MVLFSLLKNRYVQGILAILIIALLIGKLASQRSEIKRQSDNFEILATNSNEKLRLTNEEFEIRIESDDLIKRVLRDSLNIKTKQVIDLMKSSTSTRIELKTNLIDSLVLRYDTITNKIIDTVFIRKFEWSDNWSDIKGYIKNDSIVLDVLSTDSLVIINHWYKKGNWFLPKLFSKRYTKTEIVNSNKNAFYTISERIEIVN